MTPGEGERRGERGREGERGGIWLEGREGKEGGEGRSAGVLTTCPHVHCVSIGFPSHHLRREVARGAGKPCRWSGHSCQLLHQQQPHLPPPPLTHQTTPAAPTQQPHVPPSLTKPLQLFGFLSFHSQAKVSQFDLGSMGLAGEKEILWLQDGVGETRHARLLPPSPIDTKHRSLLPLLLTCTLHLAPPQALPP